VITPHRLAILRRRGASADVVRDLRPLMTTMSGKTKGTVFLRNVRKTIGRARFEDEMSMIVETFDASRLPSDMTT
jgi:hypothetical protein